MSRTPGDQDYVVRLNSDRAEFWVSSKHFRFGHGTIKDVKNASASSNIFQPVTFSVSDDLKCRPKKKVRNLGLD